MVANGDDAHGTRNRELCLEAARVLLRDALPRGGSAFYPELRAWTPPAAEELVRAFVERPDTSTDDFLTKLERQLKEVSDEAVVLAAELLYLNMVPLSGGTIGVPRKREILAKVLSWAERDLTLPPRFDEAMGGVVDGGHSFRTLKWAQFAFLVRFTRDLVGRSESDRAALLEDHWAFREAAQDVLPDEDGGARARSQYHILLWLAFPDHFEPIARVEHKTRIVEAFADSIGGESGPDRDLDRDLSAIRATLQAEQDTPVDFYAEPWLSRWRSTAQEVEQRGWLVRGAYNEGENLIPWWLEEGICTLGFGQVGELPAGVSRTELDARFRAALPDAPTNSIAQKRSQVEMFLNRMAVGDLVVTVDPEGEVQVGTITSDPYYDAGEGADRARRRTVTWARPKRPPHRSQLPGPAKGVLRSARTVIEVTRYVTEFAEVVGLGDQMTERTRVKDATGEIVVPPVNDELIGAVGFPRAWLEETVGLLQSKRQIIFYGPPGTGKTYLARAIADHVAQTADGGGATTLVQFHPSYSYEDFVQGFRPRQGENGTMGFGLVDGPLLRIAERARENPSQPHVLVIDEINRANLPKVFGELYFLLEYRKENITLQYAEEDDTFSLPENLFIIGTMNTVDRSVALVDAAMRRRFGFVRLSPDRPPVAGLLEKWLRDNDLSEEPARLLRELNRRIGDPDQAIGPSYLMNEAAVGPDGLDLVWRTQILPLLEDQTYGQGRDTEAEFGLEALRAALGARSPEQ